jgi:Fe-S-cluster-containing hydrogenase component 2
MSKKAVINSKKCDQSPFCPVKRVCPVNAVAQKKKGFFKAEVPTVDHDTCTGCGACIKVCPMGAVRMA